MKKFYLKSLLAALMLLCSTVATAHDFEVDGIYYNILSEEDKTVEVTFKGTSYSEYSDVYTNSVVIPSTVVASRTTSAVIKTFNDWTSTNKSDGSTSQTSYTLNVKAGNVLKFDWEVSSETYYDWLVITLDGTQIIKQSGTQSGSYEKTFATAGSHTLVVKYTKDSSQSSNNDEGKIYNIILNGLVDVGEAVYSVTSIGNYAFYGCTNLVSITIPNSVTSIGSYAFDGCEDLFEITIPVSVTSIGRSAFGGCTGLTSITIPESVTSIGRSAFNGCTNLESITIPNSVTSIEDFAFADCKSLIGVKIPANVTSIGEGAFSLCDGRESIKVENGNTIYDSRDNCNAIIETATNTLVAGCKNTVIPSSVTSIGRSAFFGCHLTSIEIPSSVTCIGNGAFASCSFTSITIPNSVTSIEDFAFGDCFNLKSVKSLIPAERLFAIGSYVFENAKTLCVYVPYGAKATYEATDGWNVFSEIVEMEPEGVTGDVNVDGTVDVADITSVITMILNENRITDAGDVNGDGEVDVADVTAVVRIILNSDSEGGDTPTLPEEPATPIGEAVDLGISVKWASCNVGATAPEEYGGYYAWGETEEKDNYYWSTYKYCNGDAYSMTKYCTSSIYGTVDGKTTLEPEDDVATVKWGGAWRMPTLEEQEELIEDCTWEWTTLNGVNGYRVTGPSGNSIFLPAAGCRYGSGVHNQESNGLYWSSALGSSYSYTAFYFYFYSVSCFWSYYDRYHGQTVRPVCE